MTCTPRSPVSRLPLLALLALPMLLAACDGGGGGSSSGTGGSTSSATTGGNGIGPGPGPISQDFDAPRVAITSPARGAYISGAAVVRVEGTATDALGSGIAAFAINSTPAPLDAQGRFSISLALDEGVTIISARAVDFAGNIGESAVSVMYAQTYRLATDDVPNAVGARITETSLNKLAPVMAQTIANSGVVQGTLTQAPLYRGDVRDPLFNQCLASAEVRVLSLTFGTPTILFDAVQGGFDADVTIPSLRIVANARSFCGISYSVTGTVSSNVAMRLGLDVGLSGGQFVVTPRSSTIALNNFQWGINGIPAVITNIAHSMVKSELEKRLADAVQKTLPQEVAQALQGIAAPVSRSFNGRVVTFRATPEQLAFDDQGLSVGFGANVTAVRNPATPLVPGSFFRGAPGGTLPYFGSGAGFYATAADNVINRALFTSWQAGYWNIQMDTQFFQQFGVNLPFQLDANLIAAFFPPLRAMVTPGTQIPVAVRFDPKIQPLIEMTAAPDLARLSIGEMGMTLLMDFGAGLQPIMEIALHIRAGATATFQGNALKFTVTQNVDFKTDVISTAIPLNGLDVERFLTFLVPMAIQVTTQTIAPIPIPALPGATLTNMSLFRDGPGGDYLTVSGDVQ